MNMTELDLAYMSIETLKARIDSLEKENAELRHTISDRERDVIFDDEMNTGGKWGGNGH